MLKVCLITTVFLTIVLARRTAPIKTAAGICVGPANCSNLPDDAPVIIKNNKTILDFTQIESNDCENFLEVRCPEENIIPKPQLILENFEKTFEKLDSSQEEEYIDSGNVFLGCGLRNPEGLSFQLQNQHLESEYAEFPWMIQISFKNGSYIGGGSLIHPSVVLTAAHTVDSIHPTLLKVRAGEWKISTILELYPHQDRNVADVVAHENFDRKTAINSIALLFLQAPILFMENVQTVCLPHPQSRIDEENCFATGWGNHLQDNSQADVLKKIDLAIIRNRQCKRMLRKTILGTDFRLDDTFICAGGELGKDSCVGDGGSPLVCKILGTENQFYQVGIVAWGIGCGEKNVPGVYVRTSKFRDWINDKLIDRSIDNNFIDI